MKKAVLFLKDGRLFEGISFGSKGETIGEICFNMGMTGYQKILTDSFYRRQIVIMTTSHIGNYGVNPEDMESSKIKVAGLVIKNKRP